MTFPVKGDYCGVVCSYMNDYSYRELILECVASDENRVICKALTPHWNKDLMFFHRSQWTFDNATELAEEYEKYLAEQEHSAQEPLVESDQ